MGRIVTTWAAVFCLTVALAAQPPRASGRVTSARSGAPLPGCQLDFYDRGGQLLYRVYTDQGGSYFVEGARDGQYNVVVLQAGRSANLAVTIFNGGQRLDPEALQVPW